MGATQITGTQIRDGSVQRKDLDVTTTGQAVIRKVIAGSGISLSWTGVDAGTGDVTISSTGGGGGGSGISTLNTLTDSIQTFAVGNSGTDFAISSSGSVHTFNLPDASATARGLISTGTQVIAGSKDFTANARPTVSGNYYRFGVNAYPDITANTTRYNKIIELEGSNPLISAGVTDSGYRIALGIENYFDHVGFAGTLNESTGIWARVGTDTASPTGTITNVYAVKAQILKGANATHTNAFGFYEYSQDSNSKNYMQSPLGLNTTSVSAQLHVQTNGAAQRGILVRGSASQTENLLEIQNNSSTTLFAVDSSGTLTAGTIPAARITGLSTGITSLNALTEVTQTFATGTAGADFAISSSGSTHTFNLPDASASNRGLVTTGSQTFAGVKTFNSGISIGADSNLGGFKLTNVGTPVSANDVATKAYVDSITFPMDVKNSCRVGTTANITLSGTQTIDGISVVAGDRVLVKNQTTGSQNGIYVVASGAWSRSSDADSSAKVTANMFVFVSEGSTQADTQWVLTTNDTITLDTTALNFVQFGSSPGTGINTLNGLSTTSQTFAVGTSGTDFSISSSGSTHTFNLPDASASNRGLITTGTQTFAGTKTFSSSDTFFQNIRVGTIYPRSGENNITLLTSSSGTLFLNGGTRINFASQSFDWSINAFTRMQFTNNSYLQIGNLGAAPGGGWNAHLQIASLSATNRGLVIQGASSQSANLIELQTHASATVFSVNPSGVTTMAEAVCNTIKNTGSNNLALTTTNAQDINFNTNNTARWTISSSGLLYNNTSTANLSIIGDAVGHDTANYAPLGVTRSDTLNDLTYIAFTRSGNAVWGIGYGTGNERVLCGGVASGKSFHSKDFTYNPGINNGEFRTKGDAFALNINGSGDRNTFIDFYSRSGVNYYDARIIRRPGATANFEIINNSGGITFYTNDLLRWTINSSGTLTSSSGIGISCAAIQCSSVEATGGATFGDVITVNNSIRVYGIRTRSGFSGSWGNNQFNIDWTGSAQLWIDGTNVGTIQIVSDYRVKKNVVTQTENAIDRIKQIRPVTYQRANYGDIFFESEEIREGFVAHELAEIIPSAVEGEKDAPNQIQSLKLDALCSVLVKAVQELTSKVEQLEERLSVLEGNNE
jgi:hypothetical protein